MTRECPVRGGYDVLMRPGLIRVIRREQRLMLSRQGFKLILA